MCGIVGYTGPREAGPILIEGLRRLEYRGYDSAGIALVDEQGDLFVEKRAGKLAVLQTAIEDRTPHAAIGLAHTRWATHGRPNDLNAHPHQDCTGDITAIHNEIIDNFRELRDALEKEGHKLASETDTEAIAHLIEGAYGGRCPARASAQGRAGGAGRRRRAARAARAAGGGATPGRRRPPAARPTAPRAAPRPPPAGAGRAGLRLHPVGRNRRPDRAD